MRGSGDSEGVLLGEYLKQEQDDALEILDWITEQQWCSGKVGMIGISWGGFNGLQVAARQPASLKAIVSICSTDDRYSDDIHHMGGCLLNDNAAWNSYMFSLNTTPRTRLLLGINGMKCGDRVWREVGFGLKSGCSTKREMNFINMVQYVKITVNSGCSLCSWWMG